MKSVPRSVFRVSCSVFEEFEEFESGCKLQTIVKTMFDSIEKGVI